MCSYVCMCDCRIPSMVFNICLCTSCSVIYCIVSYKLHLQFCKSHLTFLSFL